MACMSLCFIIIISNFNVLSFWKHDYLFESIWTVDFFLISHQFIITNYRLWWTAYYFLTQSGQVKGSSSSTSSVRQPACTHPSHWSHCIYSRFSPDAISSTHVVRQALQKSFDILDRVVSSWGTTFSTFLFKHPLPFKGPLPFLGFAAELPFFFSFFS